MLIRMEMTLSIILLVALLTFRCKSESYTSLAQKCRLLPLRNFKIKMDCRGEHVNITDICETCDLTNNITIMDLSKITVEVGITIPPFCFQGCSQLRRLTMCDNNMELPNNDSFVGLKRLKELNLRGNNLTILTNWTFLDVPQVSHLNLAFCNLSFIDSGAFSMLQNLAYLNLSNNAGLGFVSLPNVTQGLLSTPIEILDYSKVHKQFGQTTVLRRCDVWFMQNLTRLKEMYLDNNRMASVERNALHLFPQSLEVISVQHNQFTYGPYTIQIGCLQNLKRIEMNEQYYFPDIDYYNAEVYIKDKLRTKHSENDCPVPTSNFTTSKYCPYLNEGPFYLYQFSWPRNLKEINLRHSNLPISFVPKSFLPTSLESMDMSYNTISVWRTPSSQRKVTSLRRINLSNNFASKIEDEFFDTFPSLTTLDASNNFLGEILSNDEEGRIFKGLHNLTYLDLTANKISHIPESVFTPLISLTVLNLSYNGLSEVPSNLVKLSNLTKLVLRQNKISSLPVYLLQQMNKTTHNSSLDLRNNALDISCDNVDFLDWVSDHPKMFEEVDSYTYRTAGQVRVLSHTELKEKVKALKKGCKNYTAIFILSTLVIVGFVFCVIGGLIYRYRWRLRYLYYMAKARYRGYDLIVDNQMEYRYDAFISYAAEDYLFVKDEIVIELEEKYDLSLCIHQRDFLPGNYIAENILQAIKTSRMIVLVLTDHFLQSKWCIYEFNMARMENIYSRSGKNVILCIMYGDIDNKRLSVDLIDTIERETFLKFPEDETDRPYFWETFRRALTTK